ncbi:glycine--tRNA ligase [Mesomycoplasma molare]|uniref:Glycine--tRNA ligase n=1 Tax=Mesomycoplasma molare TaxID=171288 RepID=A0ABY5TT90_9BACT|nr:glycine--tRNA ligase [Mesomycoplasma molare]UWD33888.1 glycine--tRNA ligase [Mesomycoplasma molare]
MNNKNKDIQEIINHLKATGFVFQGSEIYGGLANTWDYGPLGSLLSRNVKNMWWKEFITKDPSNYALDTKILMNPKVWEASGHVANFSDPLIENKKNNKRYRADHIVEELFPEIDVNKFTKKELSDFIKENVKKYDNSDTDWSEIKEFHLMFETFQGVVIDKKEKIYLRPETAQGIFVNFKNVLRSTRSKLPFGVGQIGKSFRNEVTPGNFIFRTREFEQMELEIFSKPEESMEIYKKYLEKVWQFILKLGIKEKSIRFREHKEEELAHYSKATSDIEFLFPFGWGELLGVAHRGDFDLSAHSNFSGENLEYLDPITNTKYLPHVIEPSIGLDRLILALIVDSFEKETIENNETRIVLKLNKNISPYKVAILPLVKKLSENAYKIFEHLLEHDISATFDDSGTIGKRYRRQDSIGTYYSVTYDYDSLEDGKVTVRNRDTMEQERIEIKNLVNYLRK